MRATLILLFVPLFLMSQETYRTYDTQRY